MPAISTKKQNRVKMQKAKKYKPPTKIPLRCQLLIQKIKKSKKRKKHKNVKRTKNAKRVKTQKEQKTNDTKYVLVNYRLFEIHFSKLPEGWKSSGLFSMDRLDTSGLKTGIAQ